MDQVPVPVWAATASAAAALGIEFTPSPWLRHTVVAVALKIVAAVAALTYPVALFFMFYVGVRAMWAQLEAHPDLPMAVAQMCLGCLWGIASELPVRTLNERAPREEPGLAAASLRAAQER